MEKGLKTSNTGLPVANRQSANDDSCLSTSDTGSIFELKGTKLGLLGKTNPIHPLQTMSCAFPLSLPMPQQVKQTESNALVVCGNSKRSTPSPQTTELMKSIKRKRGQLKNDEMANHEDEDLNDEDGDEDSGDDKCKVLKDDCDSLIDYEHDSDTIDEDNSRDGEKCSNDKASNGKHGKLWRPY